MFLGNVATILALMAAAAVIEVFLRFSNAEN
jgi:hypothetical protein